MVEPGTKPENTVALKLYIDSESLGESISTTLLKGDSQICDASGLMAGAVCVLIDIAYFERRLAPDVQVSPKLRSH